MAELDNNEPFNEFDLLSYTEDSDSEFIDEKYVPKNKMRLVLRKLKKAIKTYQRDVYNHTNNHRKTKLGRYVHYVMSMGHEEFYEAGGEIYSNYVYDCDMFYIIADLVHGEKSWTFKY